MNSNKIHFYLQRHEQALKDLVNHVTIPANDLKEALSYVLFPGGKRLRPLLIYLIGEITETQLEVLDNLAIAIELIHCYSLVHDDLPAMDNDDFRRGKASCHRAFNEATAILIGDGLQALALEYLLKNLPQHLSPNKVILLCLELVSACGFNGMISGQSLDLSELSKIDINPDIINTIHHLKTGRLINACINLAIIAGADTQFSSLLQEYGHHLGVFFQLQDDYLDYYAPQKIGKNRASDQANAKQTAAIFYSQTHLAQLISQHYQQAKTALEPLATKASNLIEFTNFLYRLN